MASEIGRGLPIRAPERGTVGEAEMKKAEEVHAEVKDRVEVGRKEDSAIKTLIAQDLKPAEGAEQIFKSRASAGEGKGHIVPGAVIGGIIGGGVGSAVMHSKAMKEVQDQQISTVTLEWDKPVMMEMGIGQIPADYYEPRNVSGRVRKPEDVMVSVISKEVPVYREYTNVVKMQRVKKTWAKPGKPIVRWETKNIMHPVLDGFHRRTWEDGHWEKRVTGYDSDGKPIKQDVYIQGDGWHHEFIPDISYKIVGTYKEPSVKFETSPFPTPDRTES